jgi:uncharacterized protein YjbJ (UPF0337 family)
MTQERLERLAGFWQVLTGDIKIAWGRLARDPLMIAEGLADQRAGWLRQRRARAVETAARQLEEFHERNRNWDFSNH